VIRPADEDSDREWIAAEGKRFFDASGYGSVCTYRPDDLMRALERAQIVLVDDQRRGMAAAVLFPSFFDGQTLLAQELFWWVAPEHRGSGVALELLDAMEQAARRAGAKALLMLCIDRLDGNKVAGIYKRRGYRAAERTFMRKL
jgi:GNAT superfamily N-acetyltransferase